MEKIIFCGKECEVIERYEISDEYMEENGLHFKKRIRFIDSNGIVQDCADTF